MKVLPSLQGGGKFCGDEKFVKTSCRKLSFYSLGKLNRLMLVGAIHALMDFLKLFSFTNRHNKRTPQNWISFYRKGEGKRVCMTGTVATSFP